MMKQLLFLLFSIAQSLLCVLTEQEQEFVNQNLVSQELKAIIDAHKEDIYDFFKFSTYPPSLEYKYGYFDVAKFSWLNYYIKRDYKRILGAYVINNAINTYNIKGVKVVKEYLYQLCNNPKNLNKDFLVISEEVLRSPIKIITPVQALKLITIAEAGFVDFHHGNVFWINDDLAFVDMGVCGLNINLDNYKNFQHPFKNMSLLRLLEFIKINGCTEEAEQLVVDRLEFHNQND